MTDDRMFVAQVCFSTYLTNVGTVWRNTTGAMWVEWSDGHADMVYRDRRGWLWSEDGDTPYRARAGLDRERRGTRLPVLSRRRPRQNGGTEMPDDRRLATLAACEED